MHNAHIVVIEGYGYNTTVKKAVDLSNKTILVTGGTGSFGQIFIKKILELGVKEIIIFSRDENKQGEMRLRFHDKRLRFVLGDIRDHRSVRDIVRGVDYIIHAAALKWITEIEYNVWEGIKTNVIGAQNIIEAARDENVEKVISLSTDKAVEPINAYGMTKALQERLMTTANIYDNGARTVFVSTRYGNVLGSRGSVVPLFRSLIDAGQPITMTDPKMTRFMMTLEESVELVLTALEHGVGGEVFVRKMPAHTLQDLANVMLDDEKIKNKTIMYIGIRPGEKIHESLLSDSENSRTVEFGDYYVVLPQIHIPAIDQKYKGMKRLGHMPYTSNTTRKMSKEELKQILKNNDWL